RKWPAEWLPLQAILAYPHPMQLAGIGRVVFWEGGSLWLALITGGNSLHLHHAIQISLPLDGKVNFRQSLSDEWMSYAGALITPDLPHAFDAPGQVIANILFEPESTAGRALLARYDSAGIFSLPAKDVAKLVAPLAEAYARDVSDAELVSVARNVIAELSDTEPPVAPTDHRVVRSIEYIRAHVDEPLTLETLARASGLSPSRLRHLFVSETGVSTKSFILWERLNRALSLGFGGMSWTEAAHAANFADSAHLTRTCRRMFGLAPTAGRIEHGDKRKVVAD
ncbi:MAG TPA: AraC family transcriptional regulator, partial [Devosia sp.]|nr:AraC family transcriptional regulator [Devosia sp.]